MRYLKLFKESKELDKDLLREFCELQLAYLIDDGLEITIRDESKLSVDGELQVALDIDKKWLNIKDVIIPFLSRLKDQYQLSRIYGNRNWDIEIDLNINKSTDWDYETYFFEIEKIIDEGVGHEPRRDDEGFNNDYDDILLDSAVVKAITFYIKNVK